MPQKLYVVDLTAEERGTLEALLQKGKCSARKLRRAQTLLLAAEGRTDAAIAQLLHIGHATVERTRQRVVEEGLADALSEKPRPGRDRKLDGKQEAFLVAFACSTPPSGRADWSMQLLADQMVTCGVVETLSDETVRRRLKENELQPWRHECWCLPRVSAEFVWRMEAVLDLYARPSDPCHPRVCFDEATKQLVAEVRPPQPLEPGQPRATTTNTAATRWPTCSCSTRRTTQQAVGGTWR